MNWIGSGPRTARAAALRRGSSVAALALALLACAAAAAQALTVSGTVTGPDGLPAAGATVSVGSGPTVVTGPDGSYAITTEPGTIRMETRRGSLLSPGSWVWREVEPRTVVEDTEIDIVVPPFVQRVVRVVNGRGVPQEGAVVRPPSMESRQTIGGRLVELRTYIEPEKTTDADGRVSFTTFAGTVPTDRRMAMGWVTPPPASSYEMEWFNYAGPTTTIVLARDWHMELEVQGVLSDEDGPVEGATLRLGSYTSVTAENGSFEFAVPWGTYPLEGEGDGWSFGGASQRDVFVNEDLVLDLGLPARRTLTVRVLDAAGQPVPGARAIVPGYATRTDLGGDLPGTTLVTAQQTAVADAAGEARVGLFAGSRTTGGLGRVAPPPGPSSLSFPFFAPPVMDADATVEVHDLSGDRPPAVTLEPRPAANVFGWHNAARVAIGFVAEDSDLASRACTVDGVARAFPLTRTPLYWYGVFYAAGEGRHVASCTATDASGQTTEAELPVDVDRHGPLTPVAVADRAPEYAGNGGWYRDVVRVRFESAGDRPLADGSSGSGVDAASGTRQRVAVDGPTVVSGTVRDLAGNLSPVRRTTFRVDVSPPLSELTCPSQVTLGSSAVARFFDQDGESGVDGPTRGTVRLDTSSVGTKYASHDLTDRVGHYGGSFCQYQVVWPFRLRGGLVAPPAVNPVAAGVTSVPVRFSLGGDRGPAPLRGTATVQMLQCADGSPSGAPFGATTAGLAYDAGTGVYTYLWDLLGDPGPGVCAELRLPLADGTIRAVRFGT